MNFQAAHPRSPIPRFDTSAAPLQNKSMISPFLSASPKTRFQDRNSKSFEANERDVTCPFFQTPFLGVLVYKSTNPLKERGK